MNALKIALTSIIATLCFDACADRNSEKNQKEGKDETPVALQNPVAPDTQVLDFSKFETERFAAISWEKKCEAIGRFTREFAASYLASDVVISYDVVDCTSFTINAKSIQFRPKITLTKGDEKIFLIAGVDASFDRSAYQLSVTDFDLYRVGEHSTTPFEFSNRDEPFGPNLLYLETTLRAWLQHEHSEMVRVFGMPYTDFVNEAEDKYGPDSSGLKIEGHKPMTIQLLPSEQTLGTGSVNFLSVDQSVFIYTDIDGKQASSLFLGCPDITCLNNSTIGYEFLGNSLVISTPAVVDGGKSTTYIFKLSFDSWEGE